MGEKLKLLPPRSRLLRQPKSGRRVVVRLAAALLMTLAMPQWARPNPSPAQAIGKLGFADDEVGFILVDLQSGRSLAEKAADQLFVPASVAKLATAYAAERILGGEHRFSTLLLRRGADLYLQGGGDPVLTANDLQMLVAELRGAAPVGEFGKLVYDDSLLAAVPELNGRQPAAAVYNAGLSALNVDFNRIEVTWSRRHEDGGLEFHARSVADGLTVPSEWITFAPATDRAPPGASFLAAPGGAADRWLYAPGLPDQGVSYLPVKDPSLNTALVFRELAKSAGFDLPLPERGRVPADAAVIGRIDSPPLAAILAGLMRYSNNISAELIGLAAAQKLTGRMPPLAQSSQLLTQWLETQLPGTDWRGFRLENHSGFGSGSRMSPRQMAALLGLVARDGTLFDALPALDGYGVAATTGTRLAKRPILGKSGTMDYATGLAGYLPGRDGRPLAFAIFILDRERRAALDASMDPRILEPSPEARAWIARARALTRDLLMAWAAEY